MHTPGNYVDTSRSVQCIGDKKDELISKTKVRDLQ